MEFDGPFAFAEVGPRKHGEAQVDSRRVQCIDCVFQFQRKIVVHIKFSGGWNKGLGKICVDMLIANFVGIGQSIARNWCTNTHVVELVLLGMKTGLYISQAFPICKLSKGHAQILIETGKFFDLEIAVVTIDALMKDMKRKMLHYLRENKFSSVHSSGLLA